MEKMSFSGPWWSHDECIKTYEEGRPQETFFIIEFEVTNKDTAFYTLSICVQNFYQAWFNGNWLGYGPARASHGKLTIDEWAVDNKIQAGKNTIAIQVLWEGIPTFDHVIGTPGLWVELKESKEQSEQIVPLQILCTEKTGRRFTHRVDIQRGWAEEIDGREYPLNWPGGPWHEKEWQPVVLRRNDPVVTFEKRDIKPLATGLRQAKSVTFAGACSLQNRTPHRSLGRENQFGDIKDSPARRIQEEQLLPTSAVDKNLSGLTISGTGATILGVDPEGYDRTLILDFGQESSGLIELIFETTAGTLIDIGWSEGVWDEEKMGCWARSTQPSGSVPPRELCDYSQGLSYISHGKGIERYQSLFVAALRYLRIVFRSPKGQTQPVKIHDVHIRTLGYPVPREGDFTCADETLNRIFEAGIKVMENSICDTFMDCPGRERGGWLNDSFWSSAGFHLVTGDVSLERRMLMQFIDSQVLLKNEGAVAPVYPSDSQMLGQTIIFEHAIFWLLQVERHLRLYGDKQLKKSWEPAICNLINWFEKYRNRENLLERHDDWGSFFDWSRFQIGNIQVGTNCLYSTALQKLGDLYGNREWKEKGIAIWMVVEQSAWNEGQELYSDIILRDKDGHLIPGNRFSEVTNYIVLWCGWLLKERERRVWRQLRNFHPLHFDRSIFDYETELVRSNLYGLMYRFDYCGSYGDVKCLSDDLKEAYSPMLERGQTALGERLGYHGSLCHGYNGYVVHLLVKYIAGIKLPEKPEGEIIFRPNPDLLSWCQARVPWMGGYVQVWWSRIPGGVEIYASVPDREK